MTLRYLTSELIFSFVLNNLNSWSLCHECISVSYNFYMFTALSAVMIWELNSVAGRIFRLSCEGIELLWQDNYVSVSLNYCFCLLFISGLCFHFCIINLCWFILFSIIVTQRKKLAGKWILLCRWLCQAKLISANPVTTQCWTGVCWSCLFKREDTRRDGSCLWSPLSTLLLLYQGGNSTENEDFKGCLDVIPALFMPKAESNITKSFLAGFCLSCSWRSPTRPAQLCDLFQYSNSLRHKENLCNDFC